MSEPNETLELAGPDDGRWYRTQIPDWIALNPELKDGAFRLYCILRALILEKSKNKIRVLSHEQLAFLAVGKNGKPASISTIKALLTNLQEVGLISNPDGSRIVTSSGPGTIQSRRRYQITDWPQASGEYTGWRNAFDKLDAFTDDWRDSRTDVSQGSLEGQKTDLDSQKSDGPSQKTDLDGQNYAENHAPTSEDAPCLKEFPEVVALTSSSSVTIEDVTSEATPPATEKKTKKESPEEIVMERTGCTHDEATAAVDLIEAQGDNGQPIRRIVPWVKGRTDRDLQRDLAQVRRHSSAPTVTECGDHHQEMKPYGCDLCAADIKAGDPEDLARLRAHLADIGAAARPDLARRLGAPQKPTHGGGEVDWRAVNRANKSTRQQHTDDLFEGAFERARAKEVTMGIRKPGYQPYRNPADQSVYDESLL